MKAEIVKTEVLPGIRSVSGIEVVRGMIYLTSNGSLLCLDPFLNVKTNIQLNESPNEVVCKSICSVHIDDYPYIVIIGTLKNEPIVWLVKLPTPYNRKHKIWQKSLSDLYQLFSIFDQNDTRTTIEAISRGTDFIVLFNTTSNMGLFYHLDEFKEYIQSHSDGTPFPGSVPILLPQPEVTYLTDATIIDNKLLLSLKSESLNRSFVAFTQADSFNQIKGSESTPNLDLQQFCSITQNGAPVLKTVGGIAIFEQLFESTYTALAYFNNEGQDTEIVLIDLIID